MGKRKMKLLKTSAITAFLLCFVMLQASEEKIDRTGYRPTIELYKPSADFAAVQKEIAPEFSFGSGEILYSMVMYILAQDPHVTVTEETLAEQVESERFYNIDCLLSALTIKNGAEIN
jgi:hypothetical protein